MADYVAGLETAWQAKFSELEGFIGKMFVGGAVVMMLRKDIDELKSKMAATATVPTKAATRSPVPGRAWRRTTVATRTR